MEIQQGRVIEEHKTRYSISTVKGVYSAVVRGTFHRDRDLEGKIFPKVGDYVEFTEIGYLEAVIERITPRTSEVIRAVVPRDRKDAQVSSEVIVANVDIIFIVMGLDNDFNLGRAERYALLARQSKITPVILLNKSDTVADPASYLAEIKQRLPHISIHLVSAKSGTNMGSVLQYLREDTTAVLLGSSGAGKSTITNWLMNQQKQSVGDVRKEDGRGRHTTTSRQLFAIPTGGYLIDTPGMRELGVQSTEEDLAETFVDIELLKQRCQFVDCDHKKSKGCAILKALESGDLQEKRFESYLKLERERAFIESKTNVNSERRYNDKKRKLHKTYEPIQKQKHSDRNSSRGDTKGS